jgi:hypothetical protein
MYEEFESSVVFDEPVRKVVRLRHAMRYRMDNGASGCKVQYESTAKPEASENRRGVEVAVCSLPYDEFEKLVVVPGFYEVEFEMRVSKGKPVFEPARVIRRVDPPHVPSVNGGKSAAAAPAKV